MPTPSKPVKILKIEGKSHRTKKELRQRENAEEALLSGIEFREETKVRENPEAHKIFLKIKKIYKALGKNDALYEAVLNRYCMIRAECKDFEDKRELFYKQLSSLYEEKERLLDSEEMTMKEFYTLENSMQKTILDIDKQVQAKRKMLLDIEKENVMTVASALRTIPKKTEEKKNALLEALSD